MTELIQVALPKLEVDAIRVTVEDSIDAGKECAFVGAAMHIGASERNDLVLLDPTVSRHHLRIVPVERSLAIHDLGSSNGTWIDNVRIERGFASLPARLRAGRTTLRVDTVGPRVELPTWPHTRLASLVGASAVIRRTFALIAAAAQSDAPVLITGESGTGKEAAARAVHARSKRASGPFVTIDCSALTPTLFEAELFGHAKGAFTGANTEREGLLASASGGTVFFDELGELSASMQARLLRVTDTGTFSRLGETELRRVDVRFVAATHRDLRTEVSRREFREDLFHRLAVIEIVLPPLRDRIEDVPLLVEHFAEQFGADSGTELEPLLRELRGRSLPGNVRELRNVVRRFLEIGELGAAAVLAAPASAVPRVPNALLTMPLIEAENSWRAVFWRQALRHHLAIHGSMRAVARELGIHRRQLQRVAERFGIRLDELTGEPRA